MQTDTPVHYLRENARNWSPAAVIFTDSETRWSNTDAGELHTLRLWSARMIDRRPPKGARPRDERAAGTSGQQLAQAVEHLTRGRESTWLYAHNLAFDVVTTRLPQHLVSRGWTCTDAAMAGKSPWFRFAKGRKSLALVDSWSWLPWGLAEIGERIGHPKLTLPGNDDTDAAWAARCADDVDILTEAMTQLLDWWDRDKLGNWTLSGPASGWNAFRHRPPAVRTVIDPDPAKVRQDRLAGHGGRRGVWSLGHHENGPYVELDFTAAYPTIARDCVLPVGRAYSFAGLPLDDPVLTSPTWGITARCLLRTDVDRWPVRLPAGTWYPVGEFWTDLAGPDITEAARLGALVEVGPGQAHKLGAGMATWAAWCLDVQHGRDPGAPPIAQLVAKNWGRAVIGRWAMRGYERRQLGPAPGSGWGIEQGWDHGTDTPGTITDIAGVRWWVSESGTPDNAYPAIWAWVEAEVRVRLGRAIAALGPGAVLQCDTDGMIVNLRTVGTRGAGGHLVAPAGLSRVGRLNWCLDQINPVTAPLDLRVKRRLTHVDILGPQHVQTEAQRRFAGMPRSASEVEPGVFRAKTWPGLAWQLGHAPAAGYLRPEVTYRIRGPYPTGWITADRRVVPVECEVGPDGSTRIVPWHRSRYAAAGLHRADVQHPALDALV